MTHISPSPRPCSVYKLMCNNDKGLEYFVIRTREFLQYLITLILTLTPPIFVKLNDFLYTMSSTEDLEDTMSENPEVVVESFEDELDGEEREEAEDVEDLEEDEDKDDEDDDDAFEDENLRRKR